jgi:D-alanyl-D-alanine dipeptidase
MSCFQLDIEKLRDIPININEWSYKKVGRRNEGSFKKEYQNLEVIECGEKLVDIGKLGLLSEDYYSKKFSNRKELLAKKIIVEKVFLRKSHAERLAGVDKYLRERGLLLCVVSGWRHPELQKIIKDDYSKKFGQEAANRLFASIDGKVPAPHSTGASFDVELRNVLTNKKIDMDVYFNNEKISSLYWAEEIFKKGKFNKAEAEKVKNRRILYHVLCSEGVFFKKKDIFSAHPGEYWHYGDGDTLSSFLKKEKFIRYGLIYP